MAYFELSTPDIAPYPSLDGQESVATWIDIDPDAPADLSVHLPTDSPRCADCPARDETVRDGPADVVRRMSEDNTVLAHSDEVSRVLREAFVPRSGVLGDQVQILNEGMSSPIQQSHIRATEIGRELQQRHQAEAACNGPNVTRRLGRFGLAEYSCPAERETAKLLSVGTETTTAQPPDDDIVQ